MSALKTEVCPLTAENMKALATSLKELPACIREVKDFLADTDKDSDILGIEQAGVEMIAYTVGVVAAVLSKWAEDLTIKEEGGK